MGRLTPSHRRNDGEKLQSVGYDVLMSTAATTIINFLVPRTSDDWAEVSFLTLMRCIGEIEDNMLLWEKRGIEVESFRGTINRTRRQLVARFDDSLLVPVPVNSVGSVMESSDVTVLRWIDEKLSNTSLRFDGSKAREILALIMETKNLIREDDSLDDELRLFMLRVVDQAQQALSEYSVTGDFNLSEAMIRLSGAINIVKAKSEKPKIWENLRDKLFFPLAVGVMTRAPFEALGVAQMLALGTAPEPVSEIHTD